MPLVHDERLGMRCVMLLRPASLHEAARTELKWKLGNLKATVIIEYTAAVDSTQSDGQIGVFVHSIGPVSPSSCKMTVYASRASSLAKLAQGASWSEALCSRHRSTTLTEAQISGKKGWGIFWAKKLELAADFPEQLYVCADVLFLISQRGVHWDGEWIVVCRPQAELRTEMTVRVRCFCGLD
jgi:hypothetical protein